MTVRTLLLALFLASPLAAQQAEISVTGRVLGPDNQPMADQRVVLHRVDTGGGATIAEVQSDVEGRFLMSAPAAPDTSAVYFLASRYDGELYIGEPFRAEQGSAAEQVIQVGAPGMSATALLEGETGGAALPPMGAPAASRRWLLFLLPVAGVAAVALYLLVPRSRIPAERRLLIRVAELDERMTTAPAAQRENLLAERERLMAQLRAD